MRLTQIAAKIFPLSRRGAKEALTDGKFLLNGSIIKSDVHIGENDKLEYTGGSAEVDFNSADYILAQDDDICFLYKPPFMHSDRLRPDDELTMSDIIGSLGDFMSLSRLDYEADGVVGAVRKGQAIEHLKKCYLAIVSGDFPEVLNLSWSIDAEDRKRVIVNDDYTGSLTTLSKIRFNGKYSLIKVELEKAARHQVRAFCAKAGHPILGDKIYGGDDFKRLCLHCNEYEINDQKARSGKYEEKFIALID